MKTNIKIDCIADGSIDLIHAIEKELDAVMIQNGFTRTGTTKGADYTEFNYRQFGRCV